MKQIPLRDRNKQVIAYALVSDEDFDVVNAKKWHRTPHGYATCSAREGKIVMHRFIYELAHGKMLKENIDHKDRNKLNNQRDNLREANHSENSLNKPKRVDNTTGFTGVRLDKRFLPRIRYQAFSTQLDNWQSIGYFDKPEDAAVAHDIWMKDRYPHEFLVLNFPHLPQAELDRVQGMMDKPKKRAGTSKYRGVMHFHYDGRRKCWMAQIAHEKKRYKIGYYLTQEEAALAYNKKAIELYGDKAILNVI